MKIAFLTLGCKLNYAETSTYERHFKANGLEVVPWDSKADVYLINTCSVTQHSDNKCRNIIRKCHRTSPDASIVVTGCYAELKREEIREIEGVRLIFGAKEKSRVVSETLRMLGGDINVGNEEGYKIRSMSEEYREISKDTMGAFSSGERTRSFLKVQDGCNNFCAYCTVPYARGESRNIPISELILQAEQIAAKGIKEIVLTGVNTGDFGRTTGEKFLTLLQQLNQVKGIERYRISSIEPNLITEEIIDWLASGTKFQRHFHIPLQTGNDELLAKVGRHYTTSLFKDRINYIRKQFEKPGTPLVFFGIDVIVGLPGETDEMFEQTYNFLKNEIKPAFIHIFPYSKRIGTRAAQMPFQVQDSIKSLRVKRLEELCKELNSDFIKANKGMAENVLWETSSKDGKMSGYTGNYIRIERPYDALKAGTIERIII